jgi:DNA-binding MarR family transcriptional regulator
MDTTISPTINNFCISLMLKRTDRCITSFFNSHLKKYKLVITQFSILIELADGESCHVSELARKLSTDRTTLVRNVEPMKRRGYVETHLQFQGLRKKRMITITSAGLLAVTKAVRGWEEAQDVVKKFFTEAEIRQLREYLYMVYDKLITRVVEQAKG